MSVKPFLVSFRFIVLLIVILASYAMLMGLKYQGWLAILLEPVMLITGIALIAETVVYWYIRYRTHRHKP